MLRGMARPTLTLAALATAAVSGLEITSAQRHSRGSHGDYDAVDLQTADGRRLLVRVPNSVSAETEQSADLVALRALTTGVRGRLDFRVPTYIGQVPFSGTRAIVSDLIPGDVYSADELTTDADVADAVGRAIAAIHSLPTAFVGEAGLPQASAADSRSAALALIGRAADTGRLPAALVRRWENATDDDALWQFPALVINGGLSADSFLIEGDRVSGVIGWAGLAVGDPAKDLHWLLGARGANAEIALAAYTSARSGGIDRLIAQRALLYGELELVKWLLHGIDARDSAIVDDAVSMLDGLVEGVHAEHVSPLSPETGPIMTVNDVERMLDRTPRESARRDPGAHLLTDSYDQSEFERYREGEAAGPASDATGPIALDLTGFGDAAMPSESSEASEADTDATTPDQDSRNSDSS